MPGDGSMALIAAGLPIRAKPKAKPLQPLFVTRLGQAALLGSHQAKSICSAHSDLINNRFLWIDSKT